MSKGLLIVLSGPSGSGKDTVLKEFLKTNEAHLSISITTRDMRPYEEHGKDYFFIKKDEMECLIENGGVLEYAEYCGNYYGTPKAEVLKHMENGEDVILEIETAGAMKIKELMPEALFVFITTESIEVLRKRLTDRGTDDETTINKRIEKAKSEIALIDEYNYVIINNEIDVAADMLASIIKAEKIKTEKLSQTIKENF